MDIVVGQILISRDTITVVAASADPGLPRAGSGVPRPFIGEYAVEDLSPPSWGMSNG